MSETIIEIIRRFLPDYYALYPSPTLAQRRAIWAMENCRTGALGGHVHGCTACGKSEFAWHSCNHRACPQCGRADTAEWVERELAKRVGAPYFMVVFTLPAELRPLFFTPHAKRVYDVFFTAAAEALGDVMARPDELGASVNGATLILHTWNQQLLFHPHIHAIVPGCGLDAQGGVVTVKSPRHLVRRDVLCRVFRDTFLRKLDALCAEIAANHTAAEAAHATALAEARAAAEAAQIAAELTGTAPPDIAAPLPATAQSPAPLPALAPAVREMDWGVDLRPFGDGANAIKYLGRYVCRTAIGNSRIVRSDALSVTFTWLDRAHEGQQRELTLSGAEFVARYLRHVLPIGLRAIRRYGFCHPAARETRERIALHTGAPLVLDEPAAAEAAAESKPPRLSACCGAAMVLLETRRRLPRCDGRPAHPTCAPLPPPPLPPPPRHPPPTPLLL